MDTYNELFYDDDSAEEDFDDDIDLNQFKSDKDLCHEPIYESFEISEFSLDDDNKYTMENGKLWANAKYKNIELKNFRISEDMILYSKARKSIVPDNASDMSILSSGEKTYRFNISGKMKRIHLKDIVASSFLKTPKNAVISQYRNWNKDNNVSKYSGQENHYKNLRWLTEEDFINIGDPSENFKLSKQGDIYTVKKGFYRLLYEINKKNGLRLVQLIFDKPLKNGNMSFKPELHLLTAILFLKRPDPSYKYVVHKNGDISNNHYRNLVWLNTLTGIHNDGIKYYEIPGCPGYALSETNVPYTFKRGVLKRMKLQKNLGGYPKLKMTTIKKKRQEILFHRVVSVTRNNDFDPNLIVDHIDRDRSNYHHTNLHCVTMKENSKNVTPYKKGRNVLQITDDGIIIQEYDNCVEAAKAMGGNYAGVNIQLCARTNERKNVRKYKSGDYIWAYKVTKEIYKCLPGEYFKSLKGNFQGIELDFECYSISNYGTLINAFKGYSIKYNYGTGYPTCSLCSGNNRQKFSVHVLIALLFRDGRTEDKWQVNHIDYDVTNFIYTNLEWVTPSENANHSKHKYSKPIRQICMKTGNIISEYISAADAAKENGWANPSNIRRASNNAPYNAYGYFWEDIKQIEQN